MLMEEEELITFESKRERRTPTDVYKPKLS